MKIGFLGPAYPFRGGIAQFSKLLANEFEQNHEIKFFSFKKQYPKILFPGKEQIDHSENSSNFEIDEKLVPFNPTTWNATIKSIKKWGPDLLIINYWLPFFAPAFGYISRKMKGKTKIFYITHNIDFHEKWLFANRLTKYALKNADKIVTLSDSVFEDASALFPQKQIIAGFHPTYNCYNLQKFTKKSAKEKLNFADEKVILFFGYIKPYKGLDTLLKAFSLFLEKYPNSKLLIVGEVYGNSDEYYNLISKLDLEKKVIFVNRFVKDDEIELFFKAADVLALPYKQATQSGVLQIAYNMNLGAVATPIGGLPELVMHDKTGIVSESCSKKDFSKALIEYFSLEQKKVLQNIEKEKEKYAWNKFADLIFTNLFS